jgi:hypothetical protein
MRLPWWLMRWEIANCCCLPPARIRSVLREAAAAEPTVQITANARAHGLAVERGRDGRARVSGVRLASTTVEADLVVDALGRTSPATGWLGQAAVERPPALISDCGIVYFSRHFRARPGRSLPNGPYILGGPRSDLGYLAFLHRRQRHVLHRHHGRHRRRRTESAAPSHPLHGRRQGPPPEWRHGSTPTSPSRSPMCCRWAGSATSSGLSPATGISPSTATAPRRPRSHRRARGRHRSPRAGPPDPPHARRQRATSSTGTPGPRPTARRGHGRRDTGAPPGK